MSFEGYYQFLCKNRHLWNEDVYGGDNNESKCPICGMQVIWWNIVDTTNCEDDPVKLKVDSKEETCECDKCHNIHLAKPATYRIPDAEGHKVK